jgi:G6PDH family F420-dependent oxidoreductase
MFHLGYALSSEEHSPLQLVENARRAEQVGFEFALISDHFHPWVSSQGNSPFVWSVIGGISQATEHLRLGTGVTCPTMRIHPAIIAHALAQPQPCCPAGFSWGLEPEKI